MKRLREYRLEAAGKKYQLQRGEFHRHTEISFDGGNDGSLEDMFRYAIDVAKLDWVGCSDHDNGNGKEYTWWLTQKFTDAYHAGNAFTPIFCYERSVPSPMGHRNLLFVRRGIRTLPGRHQADKEKSVVPNGKVRQEARQHRGLVPQGFINLALDKGYRFGFQSSSDHISTHISYCVVLAEAPGREGVVAALKKRHCYAATEDILVEVKSGDHIMGDEFKTPAAPKLEIKVAGTKPLAKVEVLKDSDVVETFKPGKREYSGTWTDPKPAKGVHYYYILVQQEDGELAWGSPMYIDYAP